MSRQQLHPLQVVHRPLITEKGTRLSGYNKYLFEVTMSANSMEVKAAIEQAFNVRVTKVNLLNMKGKRKRDRKGRPYHEARWKKAIVTLAEGDKLELFEGV